MNVSEPINLVDYHCHLDLYPNHEALFAECDREGVHTLAVTTTPKAWPHNNELASRSQYVRAALGFHPQLVGERAAELPLWEKYLPLTRYVGEVGLDAGPRFYSTIEAQKLVFERVLTLCRQTEAKILTVHSVRAATAVLEMIEKHLMPSRSCVVLHWFTGRRAEAKRALDMGCYFSINAEMVKSQRQRDLLSELPLDRLLTETDGPFCQFNGRPIRPVNVSFVVDALSTILRQEPTYVRMAVLSNLRRLEGLI